MSEFCRSFLLISILGSIRLHFLSTIIIKQFVETKNPQKW